MEQVNQVSSEIKIGSCVKLAGTSYPTMVVESLTTYTKIGRSVRNKVNVVYFHDETGKFERNEFYVDMLVSVEKHDRPALLNK